MPPRKVAENDLMILELKPRKGVRKKIPTAKSLIRRKLKTPQIISLPVISDNDHQIPENVPQKIRKPKVPKKVNINGIKPVSTPRKGKLNKLQDLCDADMFMTATSDEPCNFADTPQKNKRAKINKQNHNVDEVIDLLNNPEDLLLKNNKTKINAESQYNIETKDEAATEVSSPNCVQTKIKKPRGPRTKKQVQNEIKIMVVDEATENADVPEKVSKVKTRRTADKQTQKKIQIIITNADDTPVTANVDEPPKNPVEIQPKIKKTKAGYKQNNNDIKIRLANEVIRNAFKKKEPIALKRKQGRPRRNKTKFNTDDNVNDIKTEHNELPDNHDADNIQDVAKKKPLKKPSTVTLQDVSQETTINASPEMEEVPKKRRKLSLKRKTTAVIDKTSQNSHTNNEGKEGTHEGTQTKTIDNTASLLNEPIAPDSTSKPYGTQSQKSSNFNCRKNSDSSISTCFSWTKDISSSSTITCVTVKSTDFVRIDKKLPIVKLTNVDHQKNRIKHIDNIIEENSFDSLPQKSKCLSECSSVSISKLNVSQTLNLSTSTLTSVYSNTPAQTNSADKEIKDETIIKLQRSLENLSSKLKKFDLEIINWIGYENDSNEANNKNFHARIFEVLKDENEVIKYCKEIKQVLLGEQQTTEVIAVCPNENEVDTDQQALENLKLNNPPNNVTDDSEKQKEDIFETDPENSKDKDTENEPDNHEEINNRSKSFDKTYDAQDNDDDDALSLFAESITGLESSRKNSSFAASVSNDKSATQPDLTKSLRIKERTIETINNFEDDKEPASNKAISIVKKQTADSSTVFNRVINNDRTIKFQMDNREPSINDRDGVGDHSENFGVSVKCFQDNNDIAVNNKLNKNLFSNSVELSDIQDRSSMNICESSSNRSPECQNLSGRSFPYTVDHNRFNISQDMSGITGNDMTENCNNKDSLIHDNSNAEYVEETENVNLGNSTVEQYESVANQLTMDKYRQTYFTHNSIFKGVCVFNLVSICKNPICNFSHKRIEVEYLRTKLKEMNEEMFIKELMYFLKWPILKRKYGGCFVEECIRRNLTVWLLFVVKEFINKVNRNYRHEQAFIIEITETTLLHLNEANLEPCTDILRSKIGPSTCLCDHLMKAISVTQNFSQFKDVFIKLTLFICRIGRSFRLDVATQLLERLCILPCDDPLARALIKIVANTNPSIFNVSMMSILESQLSKNNAPLYKELISLKIQADSRQRFSQNLVSPPMQSSHVAPSNVGHQTSTPIVRADSPDTTNTDFVNKKSEPGITRTITINRTMNAGNMNASGSESSEERRYKPGWRPFAGRRAPRPAHRLGFAPRAFGAMPKFRRRPPQDPY